MLGGGPSPASKHEEQRGTVVKVFFDLQKWLMFILRFYYQTKKEFHMILMICCCWKNDDFQSLWMRRKVMMTIVQLLNIII